MLLHLQNKFLTRCLKRNIDKCHVLVSTNKPVGIKIGDCTIYNSECEKLLGVKIDIKLHFKDHISDLRKKSSRKISTLDRVSFNGIKQKKIIYECFFHLKIQLLIWMCHSRSHERCLRIIYNGKHSSFTELLNKYSSVSISLKKHLKACN